MIKALLTLNGHFCLGNVKPPKHLSSADLTKENLLRGELPFDFHHRKYNVISRKTQYVRQIVSGSLDRGVGYDQLHSPHIFIGVVNGRL